MKHTKIHLIITFLSLVFLCAPAQAANDAGAQPKRLSIKGLSLGMPIEKAAKVLKDALAKYVMPFPYGGSPEFTDPERDDKGFLVRIGHRKKDSPFPMFFPFATITADSSKNVTQIDLSASVVDELFGTSEMGGEEFARNFLKAYKLTSLRPLEDGSGWYHVTPDGTRIIITEEKQLRLEKVHSSAEQKSKFN